MSCRDLVEGCLQPGDLVDEGCSVGLEEVGVVGVERRELLSDGFGEVLHGVWVVPDVLVESLDVRVVVTVLIGVVVTLFLRVVVTFLPNFALSGVVVVEGGSGDDGRRGSAGLDHGVHEAVVSAAVFDKEVGFRNRELVLRRRLELMRVLRCGVDDRGHGDGVATDLFGNLTVDVG